MAKNKGSNNTNNTNNQGMNSVGDMNGTTIVDQNKTGNKKGNAAKNKGPNNQSFK